MSRYNQEGIIVNVADEAILDVFANTNVISITLQNKEGKLETMQIPVPPLFQVNYEAWKQHFPDFSASGKFLLFFDEQARVRDYNWGLESPNSSAIYRYIDVVVRPGIGDTIRAGWDYGNFEGHILNFGEKRIPLHFSYPFGGRQVSNIIAILNSLKGGN